MWHNTLQSECESRLRVKECEDRMEIITQNVSGVHKNITQTQNRSVCVETLPSGTTAWKSKPNSIAKDAIHQNLNKNLNYTFPPFFLLNHILSKELGKELGKSWVGKELGTISNMLSINDLNDLFTTKTEN